MPFYWAADFRNGLSFLLGHLYLAHMFHFGPNAFQDGLSFGPKQFLLGRCRLLLGRKRYLRADHRQLGRYLYYWTFLGPVPFELGQTLCNWACDMPIFSEWANFLSRILKCADMFHNGRPN